jgi:hypothetical protein
MREITFLSTSRQCFTSLVCPETVVLSMLFDKTLTVPDIASAVQLKERARPKVPNPFNALALRKQSNEKKVVDKAQQLSTPPPPPPPPSSESQHLFKTVWSMRLQLLGAVRFDL